MSPTENQHEGIAIIGMAGRFPGAKNVAELWRNLVAGAETITALSDEQLSSAGLDPASLRADANYVAARGLIERPEWFDAAFFGITPKEAEVMDPQQRIFLEEAWTALEDAGCDPARYPGAIGVFAGMSNNTYFAHNVAAHPELIEAVGTLTAMMANEKDYLATRVAYKLNLKGPALNIYTACSTSLVAVCQACTALLNYQCDTGLAGGISITFPQERGYSFQEGGITSPDGHCRAFDEQAAGTVFSSGVGLVVLKRLAEALADGDQIYAVIKGSALNNDGSQKVSFTAPSVDGHAEVIALAQALAGFAPDTISYIEAHGTGTPLGDPIEIAGLTQAFRAGTDAKNFCAIGSVKTNIGHLDAAAGVAGLIKTALALRHGVLPASLHFQKPNPKLDLAHTPFRVNDTKREWKSGSTPRRAGVSSFGVGGTNAHVVLEEAPAVSIRGENQKPQLLILSARSASALDEMTHSLADAIATAPLADIAFTLQTGRHEFNHRRAVVAHSAQDAVAALADPKRILTRTQERREVPVAFMFPGQGAQYADMGAVLAKTEPVFRDTIARCSEILQPLLGCDLRTAISDRKQLGQTQITQPALFVIEYALAQLWIARGIRPTAMIGHSVGEYVAACVAGVFSLEDALTLIARRAALVQAQPSGAMLAVRLSEGELQPLLPASLSIAAINSSKLCVASGPFDAIDEMETKLRERGVPARRLDTSHAFHSSMMDGVVAPFTEVVRGVTLHAPKIPFISNVSADWITDAQATGPAYWAAHVREPVRFAASVGRLLDETPRALLECGPGQTLTTLTNQHPSRGKDHDTIAALPDAASEAIAVPLALGKLWLAGVTIDWSAAHNGEDLRRVSLPTYPFERKRYWAEPGIVRPFLASEKSATMPMDEPSLEIADDGAPMSRRERILAEVIDELQKCSGINFHEANPGASFTELGFDSLFLTQASLALQKRFGVPITFRRLLEDMPTPDDLATWLDEQLPQKAEPSRLKVGSEKRATATSLAAPTKAHGPFRRIDTAAVSEFTPKQRQHLDDLIARYTERTAESKRLTAAHRQYLADPRAVAGFRRAWKEMIYPLLVERSLGSKLWDVDGHEYIDITLGFGQNLLGHRPDFLVEAVSERLKSGIEIGPTSPLAGQVAALMREFSGLDRVAFCNTGSEAVTAAIRVARTVTGRSKIAMFAGAYHGIFDEVLVRPGPDHTALPIAPGIEPGAIENVLILDYGSDEALAVLRAHAHEIAAVLVEPVQSRRPELQPREFLQDLRRLTVEAGIALVFDEVVTGFRIHPGGAQAWFGVKADVATYGKVVGGGLPIGIVAGTTRFMDALDGGAWNYGDDSFPEAGVTFFAGTFVRHPLALAAAKAVLEHLRNAGPTLQKKLNERTAALVEELNAHLVARGVPLRWTHFSSMYYLAVPPEMKHAGLLWFHLRARGIHAWEGRPSFISTAHTEADLEKFVAAFKESVDELQAVGFLPGTTGSANEFSGAEFPLTAAQQELLLAAQMGPDASASFNESITIHLRGAVDRTTMSAALNRLVARHEALRTTFAEAGETQRIESSVTVELPLVDFSALSSDAQKRAVAKRIETETTTPFDLRRGPLLRAALLKLAPDRHDLVLTVHHIVCDGWSFANAATDLAALYSGRELPAPGAFREYASWLRETQASPDFAGTEDFWLSQFGELPPPMELPVDHPRGKERTFRGARCTTTIPRELQDALKRFSAGQRCTLFTTMLAAFHVLLHRLTGQDDLVVGIAAAGQAAMGRADIMGHCLNFLPIRARMSGDPDFVRFLGEMRTLIFDAFDHQNLTFGALIQKLAIPRDASHMPLLGATFNIDRSSTGLDFSGLDAEFDVNPKLRLGLELSFNLIETEQGTQLYCAFNRDLFESETIDRWLRHYLTLLAGIVSDPARSLSRLPILTDAERQDILTNGIGAERPYPQDQNIAARFAECAARTPAAIALIDGAERLTYAELDERANRVAHLLQARGVSAGDFVGLRAERSLSFVVKLVGIAKAGAAYVPLDEAEPAERLAPMKTACAFILESEPDSTATVGPVVSDAPADGPAYVLFTSGSTGVPKGVIVSHRGIMRLVVNNDYAPFRVDDVVAFASNVCFDAATFEIWGALLNGGTLVLTPQDVLLAPAALQRHLAQHGVTVLFLTTALFNRLAHEAPAMFAKLRHLVFGGEAADPHSVELILNAGKPERLVNGYGPTEVTTFAVAHNIERVEDDSIPIGRPIANTTAFILDRVRQPTPIGVAGEIYLGGPGVALGYADAPELTAERFLATEYGRVYRTGDLARWRADGCIEYLGRTDLQVKLRGFRIELGEIETALQRHPAVRQTAVALRETAAGPALVAFLVRAQGAPTDAELRAFLAQHLPPRMIPTGFVWLDALPLTPNGKLDQRALPAIDPAAAGAKNDAHLAPRTPLEKEIAELWKAVLGRDGFSIDDDFFAAGGHSLLAIQLMGRIRQKYGVEIPTRQLFNTPTIAGLVEFIADKMPTAAPVATERSLVCIQKGAPERRPFFLVAGGWGGEIEFLVYAQLMRQLGADLPLYGLKARGAEPGTQPHANVEEMAADYLAEVRTLQPHGPYLFGGECVGGVVAYEMARQLVRGGEEVALLVLLDTERPTSQSVRQFSRNVSQQKRERFWEVRVAQPTREHIEKLKQLPVREQFGYIWRRTVGRRRHRRRLVAEGNHAAAILQERKLVEDYPKVLMQHRPGSYPGQVTLLVDEDAFKQFGHLGWDEVETGGLDVHVLPGDHLSYIREHAGTAAARLRELIERAERPASVV